MEGLKLRSYVFAGLCLVIGAGILVAPKRVFAKKSESWMETKAPDAVGDYRFLAGSDNPLQSYKMNESTYTTLNPFGIVARHYGKGDQAYDVVLIASNANESFHDPRVCFTSQQYEINKETRDVIKTKTRGEVPVTIAQMRSRDAESVTCFFYKGPTGFHSSTKDIKVDLFMSRVLGRDNVDGVFYRFIPLNPETTIDQLKTFVADYLEAAKASSDGYF